MKHWFRIFMFTFCGLFLCALIFLSLSSQSRFTALCDRFFKEEMAANTLTLHYTVAEPEAYNITGNEITLGSENADSAAKRRSLLRHFLTLQTIARNSLTEEDRITYDLLQDCLKTELERQKFSLLEEPLVPSIGIQSQLPILLAEYKFETEEDVLVYLKLLSCVPQYFDSVISFETEKCRAGLFMDEETAKELIAYCDEFLREKASHFLVKTFVERLEGLKLSRQKSDSYQKENISLLNSSVFPAYEKLKNFLVSLKQEGQYTNGLYDLPKGTDYYSFLLLSQIGVNYSFEEIEAILEEALQKDAALIAALEKKNPELLKSSRTLSIDVSNPAGLAAYLKERCRKDFPEIKDANVEIRDVPKSMEPHLSPAFYLVPAIDRCEENVVYLNQGLLKKGLPFFTTLAHESYPGHLYQTVYKNACDPHPVRRLLYYGGYIEGWATYAEQLSYRYAPISSEQAALLSAVRSMTLNLYSHLDLYVHGYGWTEEDCRAYLKKFGITGAASAHEIFMLVKQQPANYLTYYLGYLEICRLKNEAEKALGDDFELKEFHKFLLDYGPAPFWLLDDYLKEWIREKVNMGFSETENPITDHGLRNEQMKNHTAGTASDGSILSVLQFFIFRIDSPELAIRKPPRMEISVIISPVRKSPRSIVRP